MAKTSAIQKNLKRIKLVKKYAKKRAALKKIINNRKLKISRIALRDMASSGKIPGITKSSW